MGTGKDTDLAREIADLVGGASVAACVFVQNAGAECFFLEVVERLGFRKEWLWGISLKPSL